MAINENVLVEQRESYIKKLLKKMTLREKLGQCIMIEPYFCLEDLNKNSDEHYTGITDRKFLNKLLNEYHIGLFLFGGITKVGDDLPRDWADILSKLEEEAGKTRLGIPMMFAVDAVHGANFVKGATIFSHNLGVSATWNPELVRDYGMAVSNDLNAVGINCNFAPTIDVARDQRWGRVYESLGEDPYLASVMSQSLVEGMQSDGTVASTAKHFIGYGESSNGMDRTPADLSERSIVEIHLPPFEAAVKSNVQAIMVNGGDVNGVPMPASKKLLTDLLRDQLNFKGVTMSDWEDVSRLQDRHKVANSQKEAIRRAFNAGLDMNMAVSDLNTIILMEELVIEGGITLDRLNEAVSNVLRVKVNLGLFEKSKMDTSKADSVIGNSHTQKIAKQIALESMTLLKNKDNLLPLSKDIQSILITGKTADSKRHLCGGWTLSWASAAEEDLDCLTILDGLKHLVSPTTKITYISDIKQFEGFSITQEDYDVCISIVGEEPHSEWFGDSMSMSIESDELAMLKKAINTGIPLIMVGLLARPQDITWIESKVDAILWAYVPGTEGALPIAETLFGDYNPSGRTTISFPKNGNQIPVVYNARSYECDEIKTRYEPLYPFGYGLSYTNFVYEVLIVPETVQAGEALAVQVQITNTGSRDGEEVVQLYLKDLYATVTRPLKSLKSFKKVFFRKGETKVIRFKLGADELSLYNESLDYVEEKRKIELQIGRLSRQFDIL